MGGKLPLVKVDNEGPPSRAIGKGCGGWNVVGSCQTRSGGESKHCKVWCSVICFTTLECAKSVNFEVKREAV